jgi:hypothetical protein
MSSPATPGNTATRAQLHYPLTGSRSSIKVHVLLYYPNK